MSAEQTRALVRFAIAVLCAAAFVAVLAIASGTEPDPTAARAMGTAVVLALYSLTAVAGTNLAARRPALAWFGYLAAGVSVLAFAVTFLMIWVGDLFDDSWQLPVDMAILSIATAHSSLILNSARPEESEVESLVRIGTLFVIAVLAMMVIAETAEPAHEIGARPIAVAAILYVLGTILMPLLRRLSQAPAATAGGAAAMPSALMPTAAPPTVPAPAPSGPQPPAATGGVSRLDHVVIGSSDVERTIAFYRDVLGAKVLVMPEGRIALQIGGQQLNVHAPGTNAAPLPLDPVRPGNSDLCFIWDGSPEAALEHLQRRGVTPVEGPVSRIGFHGPGRSVYFRDPDGSLIELISYLA